MKWKGACLVGVIKGMYNTEVNSGVGVAHNASFYGPCNNEGSRSDDCLEANFWPPSGIREADCIIPVGINSATNEDHVAHFVSDNVGLFEVPIFPEDEWGICRWCLILSDVFTVSVVGA
ncbi:hypothetical protein V6N13_108381 [Hibiscus sabdariffa]